MSRNDRSSASMTPCGGGRAAAASLGLVLALCLVGCRERHKKPEGPVGVAVVNGAPVTFEEYGRELEFAKRTSSGMVPQTDEGQLAFRRAVLEDLIERMLVLKAAQEVGITVAPEKVERELLKLKAEYHGTAFNDALAEGQLTQQELRERTRARLVMERYFVEQVYARVAVTDADIEGWYRDHPDEFALPEQVRAAQIVVKTMEEARRVQAELRKGMSFDEAARRFSLSPDAKVGGDLGFFRRGVMPAVFDQTCFALGPGKVSEIVASEYGFHLFKVLDRKAAEQRALDKVRGEIESHLLRQKRAGAQKRALEELKASAQIHIEEEALAQVSL